MRFPKWGLAFVGAWLSLTTASLGCAAPVSPTPTPTIASTPPATPTSTVAPVVAATPAPPVNLPATVEVLAQQQLAEALSARPTVAPAPAVTDTPEAPHSPAPSPTPASPQGQAAPTPGPGASPSSLPAWENYYNTEGGYLILIAPGWAVDDTATGRVVVSGPEGGEVALLHIFPLERAGRTLETLADETLDFRHSEARAGFELLDHSDITFASGLKGVRIEYLAWHGPGYCATHTVDVLAIAGSRAFELLGLVCQELYQAYRADVEAMLSSFFPLPLSPALVTTPAPTPPPTLVPTPTAAAQPGATPTPFPTRAPAPTPSGSGCVAGQVDVNSAPQEGLVRIIHIGETRAEELVQLRPFHSLDDLTRINGIGNARLADIKAEGIACVGG